MTRLLIVSEVEAHELAADERLATAFSELHFVSKCISTSPAGANTILRSNHAEVYDAVLFVLPADKKVSDTMGLAIQLWDKRNEYTNIGVITDHVQNEQWHSLSDACVPIMAIPHFDEAGVAYFSVNLLNFLKDSTEED